MTINAVSQVWDLEFPPHQKLVMLSLADNYGVEAFNVREAEASVMRMTNLSIADLKLVLAELAEDGWLLPVHGRGVHDYRLALEPERYPGPGALRAIKRNCDGYVYLLRNEIDANVYKIGRTKNPENRLITFGLQLPFRVEYVCLIQSEDAVELEKDLHERFSAARLDGEWFMLPEGDVEYIKSLDGVL
jgi:hypothetical protein